MLIFVLKILFRCLEPSGDPEVRSELLPKPLGSQRLLSVESFGYSELVFLVFEDETHLYAATGSSQIRRIERADVPMKNVMEEGNIVECIGEEYRRLERNTMSGLSEPILGLTEPPAIAMLDFLQRVRIFSQFSEVRPNMTSAVSFALALTGWLP